MGAYGRTIGTAMVEAVRTNEVMNAVRAKIAGRALAPGERLPSIRRLASTMGVSPSTVVEAYGRLAADGTIRSRPGSGFYVCNAAAPLVLAAAGPRLDREIDPLWVSRQSLDAGDDMLKPGCGWMPADWMPNALLRRATRTAARSDDATLVDYGGTRGSLNLRRLLARQSAHENLTVGLDQIMLTVSGTQAIDLVCRFLLRPGDAVIVDDPCYFNFQALLRVHQAKVVGVPYTPGGPDVEAFAAALKEHEPRLYVTNSGLHNPTGATLSPTTAHRVLSECARHGVTIIEDDIFASFEPDPSPRLAVLDGLDHVIRIGNFSKSLSASVRCGFIAARPDWIDALIDIQVATNFGGPGPWAAEVVHAALGNSGYRKHMDALRTRLDRARQKATEQLAHLGIRPWAAPRGGFYLWCELPDRRDAADVARAALREDVVLAPGNVFSPSQSLRRFMRFNVTQMLDDRSFDVLADAIAG